MTRAHDTEVTTMIRLHTCLAPRRTAVLALVTLAAACGGQAEERLAAVSQRSSHAAALSSGAACGGATVHEKHINLFACGTCHPGGARYGFDTPYTFAGGTTTAGGTLTLHNASTPTTCTVACHAPKGAPATTVAWDAAGPLACTSCHATSALPAAHPAVSAGASRADCETCHATGQHMDGAVVLVGHGPDWMTTASAGFHAVSANGGLDTCQSCHGQDLAGGTSGVACATCHDQTLPAGVTSWKANCVMCHGGTDNATGAPPRTTWGNDADPLRVGAHTRHGMAGALAPAHDCAVCHAKPADALAAGHVDGGTAEVTFGGIAAAGTPSWDRVGGACTVYCHGATLSAGGGAQTTPSWTGGPVACGDCHGVPPPAPHPAAADRTACVTCHAETMDATGAVIAPAAGGKHLDGAIQATGGHGAGFFDTTSPDFHAFAANRSLESCKSCHGQALDGVGGSVSVGCDQCHGAGWRTSCTACHGGTNDASGAPPRGTWGHRTDTTRVGAHSRHLGAARPIACDECHVIPADALDAGHVGATSPKVTFGALAQAGNATPSFAADTTTCANTYCHGGYSGTYSYSFYYEPRQATYAGAGGAPTWDGGAMACDSCHGAPPTASGVWHSGMHGGGNTCDLCHPDVDATGTVITDAAHHVDGVIDVDARWKVSCLNCH